MANIANEEKTTPMISLKAWNREVRFGNLLKQGSVNSLLWYTVEFGTETKEIYVFNAGGLCDKELSFSSDVSESVRQVCALAKRRFKSFEAFSQWVRSNFYPLP